METLISVIIPCYNSAEWIEQTLESLYAQTFPRWEILAVDDGSTDATPEILERHAAADGRVRVFRQDNAGVSAARNLALRNLTTPFVCFVDSDDLMPSRALELLVEPMMGHQQGGAEISMGRVEEFTMPEEAAKWLGACASGKKTTYITGRRGAELSLYQRKVKASMWGKLYDSSLFMGIEFPVGEIYEDLSVFYRMALRCSRLAMVPAVTYLYRLRPDSLIHKFEPGRLKVLDVTRRIQEAVTKDPDLLAAAHDRRLAAAFNMLGLLLNDNSLPAGRRKAAILQCRAIIKAFRRESLTGRNVRMKNRLGAALSLLLPENLMDSLLRRQYK